MSKTSKIIMSIHPEYVNKIFSGEKKFEYRKIQPKGWIDTIVIYSTYPVSKIVGEVEFIGYYIGPPETIWRETKEFSGIEIASMLIENEEGKRKKISMSDVVKLARGGKLSNAQLKTQQRLIKMHHNVFTLWSMESVDEFVKREILYET